MVQRRKEKFLKRVNEEFFQTTETLWRNEVEANIYTAQTMLFCGFATVLFCVLNYFGVFTVDKTVMLSISIQALLEFVIPAVICLKLKGEKKWLKIVMLSFTAIAVVRLQSVLTHNVTLLMILPVVISIRYYSSILTNTVSIIITLFSGVAEYCSVVLKMGILNLNVIKLPEGSVINYVNNSIRESIMSVPNLDYNAIWQSTLVNAYLPRILLFTIIAIPCSIIASKGRKAIFEQKEETQKTERISSELNLASDIQSNMLPKIFPEYSSDNAYDIYATMTPAKEVGGDFYDFFMVDEDNIALVMADVSGKGIPAALFMVIAKTLIKDHTQLGLEPGDVLTRINNILCESNDAGLFVTAWMGIFNLKTGVLKYANAGHNRPVLCMNNEIKFMDVAPGFVLAGMEDVKFKQGEIKFDKGDKIFLYTDGATEATNIDKELYGDNRLLECLMKQKEKKAKDALYAVRADIDEFVGDAEQFDDLTLMVFDYLGE